MASVETSPAPRLLARFVLRGAANGCTGHIQIPAGDYVTETRVVGEDIEVLMFAPDPDEVRALPLS